jgi:hypothetical protein
LTTANNLALSLLGEGKYAEAERINLEVLGARRRVLGDEHPSTLVTAGNFASSLSDQGRYVEAERIERQVLDVRRRVLGDEHPDTLTTAGNLASSLLGQGKYVAAEEILQLTLAARRRVLGTTHPDTLDTEQCLTSLRSKRPAKQPTKGGRQVVARSKEGVATVPLSPTAMAAALAAAATAEAELLAMLARELEEGAAGSGVASSESSNLKRTATRTWKGPATRKDNKAKRV